LGSRPVQTKALPFGVVDFNGDGILEGFAAVFGNVDSVSEVIVNGAFAKSVRERGTKAILGIDHERGIGTTLEVAEVGRNDLPADILAAAPDATGGLYCKGQVMLTPENIAYLETMQRMTDEGKPPRMSVTYEEIQKRKSRTRFGKDVTELVELKLIEWGPALRKKAVNGAARVTKVKAEDDDAGDIEAKAKLEGSYESIRDDVHAAVRAAQLLGVGNGTTDGWIRSTFNDYVIFQVYAREGNKHYKIPYSYEQGDVKLGEPVEVDLVETVTVVAKADDPLAMSEIDALAIVHAASIDMKAGRVIRGNLLSALDDALALLTRIRDAAKGTEDEAAKNTDAGDDKSSMKAVDSTDVSAADARYDDDVLRVLSVELGLLEADVNLLPLTTHG
jgi:HK97 family phage prohead protease